MEDKNEIAVIDGVSVPVGKIHDIILAAGDIILSASNHDIYKEKAGSSNFVTEYDIKVQKYLEGEFSKLFNEVFFFAEEDGQSDNVLTDALTFIIDPIDGTTNFICGARASVISVALLSKKSVIFGAIYDPYDNRYYSAEKGNGAFCNGNPIHVSSRPASQSLISIGTSPYNKSTLGKKTMDIVYDMLMAFADLRRRGAAALDIALIACGESDAYFEARLCPWDIAAGCLIITEAGGVCTDFEGNPIKLDTPAPAVFTTPTIYPKMIEILKKHKLFD